jgi:hypothetical protein
MFTSNVRIYAGQAERRHGNIIQLGTELDLYVDLSTNPTFMHSVSLS